MWWSWALSSIGLLSVWQLARLKRAGFITGLAVEVLWVAYAVLEGQWGFLPAAVVYSWFYVDGWKKWKKASSELEQASEHLSEESVTEQ